MRWLWPTITNGIPGSVTPATSKLPVVVFRCASNHRFGIWWLRCISFESSGFPETVCAPETTQLFDPGRKASASSKSASGATGVSPVLPGEDAWLSTSTLETRVERKSDERRSEASPEISRLFPPSGSTSSSSSSSSSLLLAAGSPSIRRTSVGVRSRQDEFTYRSAVNSGPSFARIFSRVSARW